MSAHTPGPWQVLDGAVLSKDLNAYGNWIVCGINRERTEQDEANLRLIAAAPSMLSFLKRWSEVSGVDTGQPLSESDTYLMYHEARAILRDVEGESNG